MASCFFFLHFPFVTFIIILAASFSNGENTKYAACSFLYSCGKIQYIGYPFWGGNRPQFCGISDFKLNCENKDYQNKTKMNVYQSGPNGQVLGINTSSRTIVVSQEKLFDHYCLTPNSSNITLLSTLKPDANYGSIRLFYGCSQTCDSMHSSLSCSTYFDTSNSSAYYFDTPSDDSRVGKLCMCRYNFTFLMDKRGIHELKSPNATVSSVINKWPDFMVKYTANFADCYKCKKSGGRCGSSSSDASAHFVCYCRDKNHPLVCPDQPTVKKNKSEFVLRLGVGGGIFVLVAIIAICYCKKLKFCNSKFKTQSASLDISESDHGKGSRYFGVPLYSYSELIEATDNFDQSKELGSGGFGTVYHGKLKDGREVAVKRLFEKSYKRMEQFMNEVQILTRFRHQNLVSLYGCTSHHSRELLLVYEYVKNGTVADHLYGENTKSVFLTWPVRLRIAIETATALSYLHASDIIHRDVKTNNILLDSNFSVKVADFGLSRLFPADKTHVSTAPQGTPGYLDPEYHLCYQLTDKCDVYSFGVVLVELISSLPAIDMDRHRLEINLSNYAMNKIQRCAFDELIDPQLGFALDFKVRRMTILVAELAFQCLQHNKEFRPSMDEVLEILKRIEGADYEVLQAEEMVKTAEPEVVKMHTSAPPLPSPTEDDHAQLLRNHQQHPPSPISVIEKWISGSTISSSSK